MASGTPILFRRYHHPRPSNYQPPSVISIVLRRDEKRQHSPSFIQVACNYRYYIGSSPPTNRSQVPTSNPRPTPDAGSGPSPSPVASLFIASGAVDPHRPNARSSEGRTTV